MRERHLARLPVYREDLDSVVSASCIGSTCSVPPAWS